MKLTGKTGFHQYYQSLFNTKSDYQSWLESLQTKYLPVVMIDPQHYDEIQELWTNQGLDWQPLSWFPSTVYWPDQVVFGQKLPGFEQDHLYLLNQSSLLPVLALDLQGHEQILDTCAAPGGKSLAILNQLTSLTSNDLNPRHSAMQKLIANDRSHHRLARLQKVLHAWGYTQTTIWNQPAERLYRRTQQLFDTIFIDAPCSSEKHVYNDPKHLKHWSTNRIKLLFKEQIKLIANNSHLLKPGGTLVYATCATTPKENELIVQSILDQPQLHLQLTPITSLPVDTSPGFITFDFEVTYDLSHVRRVWPQLHHQDPIFIAKFTKKIN